MAQPPVDNKVFLREVDEEVRREQVLDVWRRYGKLIVAAVVIALALLAGGIWWRQHRAAQAGAEGEMLQQAYDALGANQPAKAAAPLKQLAGSSRDGYRAMAEFTQGDLALQAKDQAGAARDFAAVAGDTSLAQPFRDLALIRQTATEYDQLQPDVVVGRLKALAVPGAPWFGSAGEMVAVAYLRMGRPQLAQALFSQIGADPQVPQSIRQRAVQMAGVIGETSAPAAKDNKAR